MIIIINSEKSANEKGLFSGNTPAFLTAKCGGWHFFSRLTAEIKPTATNYFQNQ